MRGKTQVYLLPDGRFVFLTRNACGCHPKDFLVEWQRNNRTKTATYIGGLPEWVVLGCEYLGQL